MTGETIYLQRVGKLGSLNAFPTFLRAIHQDSRLPVLTQSGRLAQICGHPCRADFALRTESLQQDLDKVLQIVNLPRLALQTINPTWADHTGHRNRSKPSWESYWTPETIELIHKMDAAMFTEYGYDRVHSNLSTPAKIPLPPGEAPAEAPSEVAAPPAATIQSEHASTGTGALLSMPRENTRYDA